MRDLPDAIVRFSVERPRLLSGIMAAFTATLIALAVLPTVWPETFSPLPAARVDTDPENMLAADEPVREAHRANKATFNLHDALVVGVVAEGHPDGVFTPGTLTRVHALTAFAKDLEGVIAADVMAPSTMDSIENAGPGTVRFEWLMPTPPKTRAEALAVRDRLMRIPFLRDTLVSGDGQALAIYLPLRDKDVAHDVAQALQARIDGFEAEGLGAAEEDWHFAGLPVAEDTFGTEMFKQMAISAPVAMLVIFALMWLYFRRIVVITAPMVVAMVSALTTMGLLVISGSTIHIMSSMIPIFIMPIAVLDAIHIISDFFDRYQQVGDRKKTILGVMRHLFTPMLFTSLTTTAGFASLALTPIPPVQAFGVFVAFGVMSAWLWTITFIPAYLMLIPERWLEGFGREGEETTGSVGRFFARFTDRRARLILAATLAVAGVAGYGISQININDNPTRWFEPNHPIRIADRVLNEHFAGTYDASLTFGVATGPYSAIRYRDTLRARAELRARGVAGAFEAFAKVLDEAGGGGTAIAALDRLDARARDGRKERDPDLRAGWAAVSELVGEHLDTAEDAPAAAGDAGAAIAALKIAAPERAQIHAGAFKALGAQLAAVAARSPADAEAFRAALLEQVGLGPVARFVEAQAQADEVFKRPDVLRWLAALQRALQSGGVGKSNTLADIVAAVHRDLLSGRDEDLRIPETREMIAQTLAQYQSSHRKDDLWHFVTPDYRRSMVWLQLKSGDNQDMEAIVAATDRWLAAHPPPVEFGEPVWSGLTYINVVWQRKMVSGMLEAFIGSFLVVLAMMTLLFRSPLWGLLSMIPLTITVALIYGMLGLIGKDYDMPVAVLSSLSLGLAIDYAIHFLARSRQLYTELGSWAAARQAVFGEPARAISRNVVVVGLGFLPLLLAPLVPYQTVGLLIAAILLAAGAASLILLPALITLFEPWLFPRPVATRDPSTSKQPALTGAEK